MCWEDIKIARQTWTQRHNIQATVTTTKVIEYNPLRYSLLIAVNEGSTVFWGLGDESGIGNGISSIGTLQSMVLLDLIHHGDIVRQPLYVATSAGTANVVVYEVSLGEKLKDNP